MTYKIGILDQSPKEEGLSNYEVLQRTVELAKKAEEWGYERFWVSEHHNTEAVLGSSPEVLASYLLANTNSIRIGSGGVMLQHYSPYKVAENFQVLATLAPGRVDLGVGKGPGGLPLSTEALQFGAKSDGTNFEKKMVFLHQLLTDTIPETDRLTDLRAIPLPPKQQEVVLLGASPGSASFANQLGVTFSYAMFLNNDKEKLSEAVKAFRTGNKDGRFILAVPVYATDTREEAIRLTRDKVIVKVTLASGRTVTVLDIESGEQFGKESGEDYKLDVQKWNIIAGTKEDVQLELDELYDQFGIDEFILHTPITGEGRIRSFELLSPNSLFATSV